MGMHWMYDVWGYEISQKDEIWDYMDAEELIFPPLAKMPIQPSGLNFFGRLFFLLLLVFVICLPWES